ncbi:TPA: EexN family lipoprotein [Pseudomonas aeruginosa]|uniref:EexN family lipoprotein n=1 Tax=Pseudomonas aeruginosa TaxID=287 RepID=UPI0018C47E4D|nr:EexN family lipoprotein [Pseudomonas aeruginosa]MBG4410351.1 EexN family lipoprotein [Pseudomonas aeruginosa]
MTTKLIATMLLVSTLSACGSADLPKQQAKVPAVDELAANPERLKALRHQCKTERPTMGDVLCNRVAEATNKRFFSDGKTPYTPSETPPKF